MEWKIYFKEDTVKLFLTLLRIETYLDNLLATHLI